MRGEGHEASGAPGVAQTGEGEFLLGPQLGREHGFRHKPARRGTAPGLPQQRPRAYQTVILGLIQAEKRCG